MASKWIKYGNSGRVNLLGWLLVLGYFHQGCVEPFEAETQIFESAIVIEATITNEEKNQEILLSRSFALEEEGPSPLSNASVQVLDDQGTTYVFNEADPGRYVSDIAFAAAMGSRYELRVATRDGSVYASEPTSLTPAASIESVYPERMTNDDGVEGVAIRVDAGSSTGNARNYRYTYEETFKIIAPSWNPNELVGVGDEGCGLEVVYRNESNEVCYRTQGSNSIILTDTNEFLVDKVTGFVVKFINRNNYSISHRYSILVRQMVQSDAAYTFYETLNEFSGSESLFSETQPGFLLGNVFAVGRAEEKVLGYFDVASVTEQRLFFNYDDLFPGEPLPPYIIPCKPTAPLLVGKAGDCVLRPIVEAGFVEYFGSNDPPPFGQGPFLVVPVECGDCTVLGQSAVPEFWTE